MDEDREVLAWVSEQFAKQPGEKNLIAVLLALQDHFGYLPKSGLREVAGRLNLSPANVFGVATFYNQFRFVPPGRYPIKVCLGTACHIKQATKVVEQWERRLDIREGEVTPDREYSLDRVACVGCCTLAPVIVIGDEVIGGMSPNKVDGILLQHRIQRERSRKESSPEDPGGEET